MKSQLWVCCNQKADETAFAIGIKNYFYIPNSGITDLMHKVAFEFCQCAKWESFRNQELKDLAILKCFVKVDHLPLK